MSRPHVSVVVLLVGLAIVRVSGQGRSVTTQRFEDYVAAHQREHVLLDKALDAAKANVDFRLSEMNNLRAQINAERGLYFSRTEHDLFRADMEKRLGDLEREQAAERSANLTWTAAMGIFFVIVQVGLRFAPHGRWK